MYNNKTISRFAAVLVGCSLLVACDVDEPGLTEDGLRVSDFLDEEGRVDWRNIQDNGIAANGVFFNGLKFNGLKFNGLKFNGLKFNSQVLNTPKMNGNKISGKKANNETVEGTALEGAVIDAEMEVDGVDMPAEFRLSSMSPVATAAGSLDAMLIEGRLLPNGVFTNVCENDAPSVSLRGNWDPTTGAKIGDTDDDSTWACLGAALGDCATWGYVPGGTYSGTSLAAYHQACTRTKRADYCGTGVPHTQNGTSIDIYDNLGVQAPGTAWPIEAMYNENGAVCLNNPRKTNFTKDPNDNTKTYIGCNIPACVDVNNDGVVNFADYPTAKIAVRNVPTDPV